MASTSYLTVGGKSAEEEAEELNSFGILYASGYRVPQDYQIALLYFRKAAKLQQADALYNLSVAYDYGLGVAKNHQRSMQYQLKAAQQGSLRSDSFFSNERYLDFSPLEISAESPEELYYAGLCYETGLQVLADYQQAYQYYQQAAKQGFNKAQDRLGYLLENGLGVAQDLAKAFDCYRQAAQQGDGFRKAQFNLGRCYRQGIGCDVDLKLAEFWLREALKKDCRPAIYEYVALAESGFSDAQTNLGHHYFLGNIVRQDYAESRRWSQLAAEQKDKVSIYNLGICFLLGKAVKQDYKNAFDCFLKSAELGNSFGQRRIGFSFRDGGIGLVRDYGHALFWFDKSAAQEDAHAAAAIGFLHFNGEGVARNYSEAFHCFIKAALLGSGWGKYGLGLLNEKGLGVEQNSLRAVEWYRKAYTSGIVLALAKLDLLYARGFGQRPHARGRSLYHRYATQKGASNALYYAGVWAQAAGNYRRALKYYQLSAGFDHPAAQNNLGVLYEQGKGVPQDYPQAVKYYKQAAEKGDGAGRFNLARCYQLGLGVFKVGPMPLIIIYRLDATNAGLLIIIWGFITPVLTGKIAI